MNEKRWEHFAHEADIGVRGVGATRDEVFFDPVDPIGEYDETVRRRIELHPELSLMFAVLEDAVSSFQKHVSARDQKGRDIFRKAEDWILDDRNDEIFSFVSICEHLGINPKYLRQGLLRWKQKRLTEQGFEHPARLTQNPFSAKTSAIPVAEVGEKQEQARAKPEPEEGPDALTLYLQEVASIPRLTHERESDLIKQMREGQEKLVEAQASSGIDRSSALSEIRTLERELELPMEEIKRRARSLMESEAKISSARKELIEAHLYMVVRIARKFSRLGLPLLDLIQDGNIGLLRAAEKFDPRLGLRFSTYAWWWIRLFVRQGAIESARIIRVPTTVMEQWRKLGQTRHNLFRKLGREPMLREVAAEMVQPLEEVLRIVGAMRKPISLEAPVGEEGRLAEFVENRRSPQPFETAAEAEVRAHVAKALADLPRREEAMLRTRFGIGEAHEHTLEEVAGRYSITRERVRQIEHRAFERLRLTAQRAGAE